LIINIQTIKNIILNKLFRNIKKYKKRKKYFVSEKSLRINKYSKKFFACKLSNIFKFSKGLLFEELFLTPILFLISNSGSSEI